MNEIGCLYRYLERVDESEAIHRHALTVLRANGLPATDLQIIWTVNTLGRCLRGAGRLVEATELLTEALEFRPAVLGATYPLTLWMLSYWPRVTPTRASWTWHVHRL